MQRDQGSSPTPGRSTGAGRDQEARQLWDEHYSRLGGWCTVRAGDREAGQEIAAEAFARLLAHWDSVRDARGFLYVTANNLINDMWRRQLRDRKLTSRLAFTATESMPAADGGVRDLIDRLPAGLREAILLYYYADLSVAEIAKALHRPPGTIKRRLADARGRLQIWIREAA
jgi:RNA polymerase sigma-70 factor (ECF subfamily)